MKTYKKPVVTVDAGMAEGVYQGNIKCNISWCMGQMGN